MPVFDYGCKNCGAVFESIQPSSISEMPCKSCDGGIASKLPSKMTIVSGVNFGRKVPSDLRNKLDSMRSNLNPDMRMSI